MISNRFVCLVILGALGFAGCSASDSGVQESQRVQTPDEIKASALALLRTEKAAVRSAPAESADPMKKKREHPQQFLIRHTSDAGIGRYRNSVQQLNLYLDQDRNAAGQIRFDPQTRSLIETQLLAMLPRRGESADTLPSRMKDLERSSYSLLDSNHLDACFLLRDAAAALRAAAAPKDGGPDESLRLARLAFEWVVRQIHFTPRTSGTDAWPAHEILRRGTGDGEERARVFLALVEQLELDGCMVGRTIEVATTDERGVPSREKREQAWVPGVRIDKDIFLFESRLGVPIPGPGGQGIATLRQVRQDPAILKKLYEGDSDPVTPAQLEKPAVLLLTSLTALAPRMKALQEWLAQANNNVILFEDIAAQKKRFESAGLDADVRFWAPRNLGGYPTIILARYVENPLNQPRLQNLLVPRRALVPGWVHELATRIGSPEHADMLFKTFDSLFQRVRLEPDGIRDLIVRGRPEEAVDRILELEDRLDKAMDIFEKTSARSATVVQVWGEGLVKQYQAYRDANAARLRNPGDSKLEEEVQLQRRSLESTWIDQRTTLNYLNMQWALPELREHLAYFMGLAKMELAVRAELRAAQRQPGDKVKDDISVAEKWGIAANWFERYLALVLPRPRNHWAPAVELHLATCRQHAGKTAALK